MKDATRHIQPADIDTSNHFYDAFDKNEREISAKWIVRFCQNRDEGWKPFTYKDIDDFYRSKGMNDGFWMNQLDEYGIIPENPHSEKPTYAIQHDFVSRCYKSSPRETKQ